MYAGWEAAKGRGSKRHAPEGARDAESRRPKRQKWIGDLWSLDDNL